MYIHVHVYMYIHVHVYMYTDLSIWTSGTVQLGSHDYREAALHRVMEERDEHLSQLGDTACLRQVDGQDGHGCPAAVEGGERGIAFLACRVLYNIVRSLR